MPSMVLSFFVGLRRCGATIGLTISAFAALAACAGWSAAVLASDLPIRGVVKAVEHASLSTEQPMRALEVSVRDGDSFRRGQILVAFDCRRQRADLRSASAQVREAELNLSSSISLDRHNAIGRNDLQIARARLDRARAEMASLEARAQDCEIIAPFDGRVVEVTIRPLEFTSAQRPFLVIIDDSRVEIELIAPASALTDAVPGAEIVFAVDELQNLQVPARLKSVAAAVDPVSKTARLVATVTEKPPGLLAGMSGTAVLKAGVGRR